MNEANEQPSAGSPHPRRTFVRNSLAGTAGISLLGAPGLTWGSNPEAEALPEDDDVSHMKPNPSNVKLGFGQFPTEPEDELLTFAAQFGVRYVACWTSGSKATAEYFKAVKERFAGFGITPYNIGNRSVHNVPEITLNLPGRDEKIEEYIRYLRNLGKAGITYTTYAHMADSVWHTGQEPIRGGIGGKSFSLEKARKMGAKSGSAKGEFTGGPLFPDKPIHGRFFMEEEIWDNFEYFIRKVAPVAEAENVRIGIHPDDPPLPELGGVPRCIFSSFDGYRRAMEIADSPNVGLCLCTGCWLEGGDRMGKDLIETIHHFGKQQKLFKIHFRNVGRPLPNHVETFLDDGYMDMYKVMKALVEVNNDCLVIDDHIPPGTIGGYMAGRAFNIGYMRALLERAVEEVYSTQN